jgi:hypothetical protein
MDTPTKSSIDDAIGSATVETYDEFRYVMPGDGSPTQTQLAVLMPAFRGKYHQDPRHRDTFRVRAVHSSHGSRVWARTDS